MKSTVRDGLRTSRELPYLTSHSQDPQDIRSNNSRVCETQNWEGFKQLLTPCLLKCLQTPLTRYTSARPLVPDRLFHPPLDPPLFFNRHTTSNGLRILSKPLSPHKRLQKRAEEVLRLQRIHFQGFTAKTLQRHIRWNSLNRCRYHSLEDPRASCERRSAASWKGTFHGWLEASDCTIAFTECHLMGYIDEWNDSNHCIVVDLNPAQSHLYLPGSLGKPL